VISWRAIQKYPVRSWFRLQGVDLSVDGRQHWLRSVRL